MLQKSVFLLAVGLLAASSIAQSPKPQPGAQRPSAAQPAKPEVTLKVGDKAPAIRADKWVKGKGVKSFEAGKVYVVEFWATWCPPCVKSIPHLTELQQKHDNLTVIGVAASERQEGDRDRRLAGVEQFVRGKGKQMDYTVAYEGDQQMYKDWMTAAGQRGIPAAFLVDGEGKIAWIGNPLSSSFDSQVEKALNKAEKSASSEQSQSDKKSDRKSDKKTDKQTNKDQRKDQQSKKDHQQDSQTSTDSDSDSSSQSNKQSTTKQDSSKSDNSQKQKTTDSKKSEKSNKDDGKTDKKK